MVEPTGRTSRATGSSLGRVSTSSERTLVAVLEHVDDREGSKFGSLRAGLATRMSPAGGHAPSSRVATILSVMPPETPPVVLAIAAHDPLGGAGLAADLTTFAALGVHGTVAVTAVTAQHLDRVDRVEPMSAALVAEQIDAITDSFAVAAVKTGLLGSAEIVDLVADRVDAGSLPAPVVDPVLVDGAAIVSWDPTSNGPTANASCRLRRS